MEKHESFTNTAWRELYEETGVARAELAGKLGQDEIRLEGAWRVLLQTELLTHRPGGHAVTLKLQRGTWVRELERFGAYSKVVYEEVDVTSGRRLQQRDGWIATRHLARRMVRHHFHMICRQDMPATWEHHADGHRFKLAWSPLNPRPRLAEPQDRWLAEHWAALRAATADR